MDVFTEAGEAVMETRMYTVSEAAAMLGVSTQTMRKAIGLGQVKASCLSSRATRIPKEEIERLLRGEKAKQD